MRALIVSDTHGRLYNLEKVLKEVGKIDMLIHLGDVEGDEQRIEELAGCPVEMVSGNNDFFTHLQREKVLEIGGYKIWLTHGHYYYVGFNTSKIKEAAAQRGCDVVMFGHIHRPVMDINGSVWAINPGSISFPRQENRKGSYIIMDTTRWGADMFELCYV